jgi:ABC-2 type transport system permease protein
MLVMCKREFISLFKGIKSIIMIAILFAVSYYAAKFSSLLFSDMELKASEAANIHTIGLLSVILLLGQLFVFGLSHDTINREIHERTMRFLVTRVSRSSILFGKFLGIWMFWFVCIVVSFLLVSIFSKKFDLFIFSQTMSLVTYQVAFALLLSVLIPRPGLTMFLGNIFGLLLPILGFWTTFSPNGWVNWMKFFIPFYYLEREDFTFLIILGLAVLMMLAAAAVFKRREC